MKLKKYLFSLFCNVLVLSLNAAEPKIVSVTAQQRYPWNGLVDIEVQLSGTAEELSEYVCTFAATNVATKAELARRHLGSGKRHARDTKRSSVGLENISGLP